MPYERYPQGSMQDDFDNPSDTQNFGRDYGYGRGTYTSAREYEAAGTIGPDRGGDRGRYGARDYGHDRYAQRDRAGQSQGGYRGGYGPSDRNGPSDRYGQGGRVSGNEYLGRDREYHGAYAADGRRFEDVGRYRHADDDNRQRGYGRQPQGYDYEDRGFFQRAGDEVRSWFGDDEAERRREMDSRYDERGDGRRYGGGRHDEDYHNWRSGQVAALDRDYEEYRRENRTRFENEFSTWRSNRQGQRDQLTKVQEHQEVVGSDGAHVGTVDKVKGDRILLTKNDADAGGQHHSIPSNWIASVDGKVTLSKTADEAKQAWRDEDRNSAMFNYGDNAKGQKDRSDDRPGEQGGLNRSFSGTY